jgi:hypothetical protein
MWLFPIKRRCDWGLLKRKKPCRQISSVYTDVIEACVLCPGSSSKKTEKKRGRIWQGILIIHLLMPGFVGRSNCDEKPNPSRDCRQGILRKITMCLYTQASTNLERERERERSGNPTTHQRKKKST